MGCWNQTCSLTNLPIKYEDKVVIIPLMLSNPKIDGLTYDINDKYSPFCVPIIGRYNDYGGIEDVENEDIVISILTSLNFFTFDKDEKEKHYITFDTCDDFFDMILEENLYIEIDNNYHKVNYMMIHYDLYNDLINEISTRCVNCNKNKKYRLMWQDKICHFIAKSNDKKNSNKNKEELLSELEKICSDILLGLDENSKKSILKDISSPSYHLQISTKAFNGFIYDLLIKSLIDNYDSNVLKTMLDMLMFEKALQLLRSGYLVNTGFGHQGYELKLHLIVSNFVNSYIQRTIDTARENFYTEQEIDDYLKEEIFWNELQLF